MLVEQYDGEVWRVDQVPTMSGTASTSLAAVSCWNDNGCEAVGQSVSSTGTPANTNTLVERWNGSIWTITTGMPSPTSGEVLGSRACTDAADRGDLYRSVVLSGRRHVESYGGGTFTGEALTLEYDGSWSELSTAQPSGVEYAQLGAVTCGGDSESNCWAVGYRGTEIGGNPSDVQMSPLVMTFDSEEWTIGTTQSPNGAGSALLTGVDCSSGQHCFASGYWGTATAGTNSQTLMEEWDGSGIGTDWEQDATSDPNSGSNTLSGVSCGDDTPTCLSVGVRSTGTTLASADHAQRGGERRGRPDRDPDLHRVLYPLDRS